MRMPLIRFKGFSGEWQEKELSQLVDVCSGRDYKHLSIGNIPVFGTGGYMLSVNEALSYNEDAIGIGRKGTIDKPYVLKAPFWTVDTLFYAVPKKENYLPFLYTIFQKINWKQKDESTGVPSLSKGTINSIQVFTSKINEQIKIGDYFQRLDSFIAQKEKKYQKLKQFKTAMLSQMFPKEGECTPKLRFKGFSGEWEAKNLRELCSLITKGTTPLDKSNNGNVNFIKIENINSLSGKITITTKISKEEHENYLKRSQLKENDILFSIAGTLGRVTIIQQEVLPANTNQALAIIRLKEESLEYITTYLKGRVVRDYIKKNPTIGAQPNLSLEQIGNIELLLPKFDEQTKIGNYFQKLDTLIDLHQKELEKLKNMKKALLAKMFV